MLIWLILAAALALRLYLALSYDGQWGVDGGAYWLSVNTVLGDEPTGAGFPRPPLAPGWLLVPFTIFGTDVGYKVWSVLASMAPVVPVYLLARRLRDRVEGASLSPPSVAAPFAVGFLLVDWLHAEMFVTGALPLIAFGLLGIAWWAMGSLAVPWSRRDSQTARDSLILAVCIGLIPFVNQTTAGLAVITLPVYLAGILAFAPRLARWAVLKHIVPPLLVGGIIALIALPWYMEVLPGNGMLDYPGPVVYFTRLCDLAWLQLALGWSLGLLMIRKGEEPWLQSLGVLCCLLGTLTIFLSFDETIINLFYRSRYLMAVPFYIGVTWAVFRWAPEWFAHPRVLQAVPIGLALIVFGIMGVGYISQVQRQADLSAMITPETHRVLEDLRNMEAQDGIITNSFTLALWISALNKVPSPHTWNSAPPPRFIESDRQVRCVLGWVPGCDPMDASEKLGARFILIEERFPYYNERAPGVYGALNVREPWAELPQLPWLEPVYHQGTTLLFRIVPPSTASQ